MRTFDFDIETYSAIDLTEFGGWIYARHPNHGRALRVILLD
jgi:hypothetical protein